jgi:hypothetical protein
MKYQLCEHLNDYGRIDKVDKDDLTDTYLKHGLLSLAVVGCLAVVDRSWLLRHAEACFDIHTKSQKSQ